jgi:hypothetical protein
MMRLLVLLLLLLLLNAEALLTRAPGTPNLVDRSRTLF